MKIILPKEIHEKIMYFVDNCPLEVGGMGTVKFDKDKQEFTVTSVCLPTQEVGSAHTDLDADSVAKYEIEAMKEDLGWFNFWWHSHVNMSAFWSGTDTATIKEMGKQGLCVAVVFNKKKECRGAVFARSNEDHVPDYFNENVTVEWKDQVVVNEEWARLLKENVRQKTFPVHTVAHQSGGRNTRRTFDPYDMYDDYYQGHWHQSSIEEENQIRTGISKAYKASQEEILKKAVESKEDQICFSAMNHLGNVVTMTCSALVELSRTDVQKIINTHQLTDTKAVELMSRWYYTPATFGLKPNKTILSMADM